MYVNVVCCSNLIRLCHDRNWVMESIGDLRNWKESTAAHSIHAFGTWQLRHTWLFPYATADRMIWNAIQWLTNNKDTSKLCVYLYGCRRVCVAVHVNVVVWAHACVHLPQVSSALSVSRWRHWHSPQSSQAASQPCALFEENHCLIYFVSFCPRLPLPLFSSSCILLSISNYHPHTFSLIVHLAALQTPASCGESLQSCLSWTLQCGHLLGLFF